MNKGSQKINSFPKKWGMVHSTFGDCEGVSIVMEQIENSLINYAGINKKDISYLVGNYYRKKSNRVFVEKSFWFNHRLNLLVKKKYSKGFSDEEIKELEKVIYLGVKIVRNYVRKTKVEVIISHNSCYPVNFIMAMSLSRYFDEEKKLGRKVPRYIVWWHDSHLERSYYKNPSGKMQEYLLEGVPGHNVDNICFINSTQYETAKKYFKKINKAYPGFSDKMGKNHSVVYNTTKLSIEKFSDLKDKSIELKTKKFLRDFDINSFLKKKKINFDKILFCLQGTRMVDRKRIDFALKYAYSVLRNVKKRGMYNAMYFMISGHNVDGTRKILEKLNKELSKKYNEKKFFLIFAEDYYKKTKLTFFDYPVIFARLKGFSTYFSEVEGFGNNLLEVLASGLPTAIYEYPIFKSDIDKFGFDLVKFKKYSVSKKGVDEMVRILADDKLRRGIVNYNLKILKKNFGNDLIFRKLKESIYKI